MMKGGKVNRDGGSEMHSSLCRIQCPCSLIWAAHDGSLVSLVFDAAHGMVVVGWADDVVEMWVSDCGA
jgi:hypothetical protein